MGWRGLFYVFGLLGLPLLAVWLAVVPPQTPRAPAAGQAAPPKLSSLHMMSKSATWAIIVVNFVNHWGQTPASSSPLHTTFALELQKRCHKKMWRV